MARSALHGLPLLVGLILFGSLTAQATVLFQETFDNLDAWVPSKHQENYGAVELSAGDMAVDEARQRGLRLTQDARFYAISRALPTPVSNDQKDLVVSFSARSPQDLQCGGSYLKFFTALEPADLHGESPYWLMFGPDVCGGMNRIHIIFHYAGKNHEWKRRVPYPNDRLTHIYTLHLSPGNTYELFVDGASVAQGSLEEDWEMLSPREMDDPSDTKPSDWVDDATMPDPTATKPADWDATPATIVDPAATKPADWVEEEDGTWEAPVIPNPAYRGAWSAPRIQNPAYQGPWRPRKIPNPAFQPDATLYQVPAPLQYVGVDVWQVESGTIFGHILLADDVQEVLRIVQETLHGLSAKEKEAVEAAKAAVADEEPAEESPEDLDGHAEDL